MATFHLPVHPDRFRVISDPEKTRKTVYALVNVLHLPVRETDGKCSIAFPLSPDPRVPKKSPVTRVIVDSLKKWDGKFHLKNRGITISAAECEYDNTSKRMKLVIPDEEQYGILDGGHTTFSIESVLGGDLPESEDVADQFVRLEILIGCEDVLGEIAQARNTSMQVKLFSLKNKEGNFEWLKSAVSPFADRIRWSENDPEEFPVLELIQILTAVNLDQFGANNHPIEAYNNAGKCLGYIISERDNYSYKKLANVALDVWKLYDTIRYKWWDLYNKPHPTTGKHGRAGRLKEVHSRKRGKASLMRYVTLDVQGIPEAGDKHVEKGLAIPVLAAFRCLLQENQSGNYEWKQDPIKFFERHGQLMVRLIMDASDSRDNNPHKVGRDATVYDLIYRTVENEVLRAMVADQVK